MNRFKRVFTLGLIGSLLLLPVLITLGADTTTTIIDPVLQAKNSLKLKDNNDGTFSYQTMAAPSFPGTFVVGTSTGGAQANSPTLPAVAAKTNYCAGFSITGLGATSATSVAVTLSDGTNTLNYTFPVPAGATVGCTPLNVAFNPPLPASAVNTAWTLTVGSFGTGNTAASANIWGYKQ